MEHETRTEDTLPRATAEGSGTPGSPWVLATAAGTSSYTAFLDVQPDPAELVCRVGSTTLRYRARIVEDLHAWLLDQQGWVPLGAADEGKTPVPGTVEAWGRSTTNPVGGWYGLRTGYRGRVGAYLPPLLEALGLAELSHRSRGNEVRALPRR